MKRRLQHFFSILLVLALFSALFPFMSRRSAADAGRRTVTIHYNRADVSGWDVWMWIDGQQGFAVPFKGRDKFGAIAEYTFKAEANGKKIGYIVRKADWSDREQSNANDGNRLLSEKQNQAWVKQGEKAEYTSNPNTQGKTTVTIHYNRADVNGWDVWMWIDGKDGFSVPFDGQDSFGYLAEHNFSEQEIQGKKIGYIVRKTDWSDREQSNVNGDGNRFLAPGQIQAYVKQGDKTEYDDRPAAGEVRKLKIHYNRPDVQGWKVHIYGPDLEGKDYEFTGKDEFGPYAEVEIKTAAETVNFILHRQEGDNAWAEKEVADASDGGRPITINKAGVSEVWVKQGDKETYLKEPLAQHKELSAKIHYHRYDAKTLSNWKVLYWSNLQTEEEAKNKKQYVDMTVSDKTATATVKMKADNLESINCKLQRFNGTEKINEEPVRQLKYFNEQGMMEAYWSQKDPNFYKTEAEASAAISYTATIKSAREVEFKFNRLVDTDDLLANGFKFETKQEVDGEKFSGFEAQVKPVTDTLILRLNFDIDTEKEHQMTFYTDKEQKHPLTQKLSVTDTISPKDKLFDSKYAYAGELGAIYTKEKTTFKVWAPTAASVNLLLYEGDAVKEKLPMIKADKGVYQVEKTGDLDGQRYMYEVTVDGKTNVVTDPYVRATTANSKLGVVVNPQPTAVSAPKLDPAQNPIIYELHVRDFSHDPNGNMQHRGKYLAFTEKGTKTDKGFATGLDYLKSLGVTHVQLLPVFDYNSASVDELNPEAKYNWGYDPINYNVPEGSYSTDPNDPYNRIRELQQAIDSLHQAGLGVIMDVVFNHVGDVAKQSFNQIVPGYYFRYKGDSLANGSGCGNETASEKAMMRKYIVDSVKYWAKTYKFDGFRFDLMGLHDVKTMNEVREELQKINPNIVILGEGWNMGNHPAGVEKANQLNAYKMPHVGMFSDDLRDGVKGSVFKAQDPGFVNGAAGKERQVLEALGYKATFGGKHYSEPRQLIQYVEAHDNFTLWDKLGKTNLNDDEETRLKMQRLASAIPLLSQGTPFIHAGQEFARTKQGEGNSYNKPDSINQLDWNRAQEHQDLIDYFRGLIAIRKQYKCFSPRSFADAAATFTPIKAEDKLLAYKLKDGEQTLYIVHNASKDAQNLALPDGKYQVLAQDGKVQASGLREFTIDSNGERAQGTVEVAGLSTTVLVSGKKAAGQQGSQQQVGEQPSSGNGSSEAALPAETSTTAADETARTNGQTGKNNKIARTGESRALAGSGIMGVLAALGAAVKKWRKKD